MSSCPGRILLAYIYEYSHLKPVQVGVVKEQINQAEEKKGKNGDVHLKVDICCVACIRKVRRVLIELNGKVTVAGDVKPEACLKAMAKIRKRASLWGDAEGRGKERKKKKKKSDGS